MKRNTSARNPRPTSVPDDWIIDSPHAIVKLLQAVVVARSPAQVSSIAGEHRAQIRFVAIDADAARLTFVLVAKGSLESWLIQAKQLVFKTVHEQVPIEFTCEGPSPADDPETYRVTFPEFIVRAQRRETYRLPAPDITCELRGLGQSSPAVRPQVVDISCGGIDVVMPLAEPPLSREASYACSIDLPALGVVQTDLEIVAVFETPAARRYGCRFVRPPERTEILLQRYILEEQRARRARLG
jgi:c-di-GMP-binding flagellar brake protein YcgR